MKIHRLIFRENREETRECEIEVSNLWNAILLVLKRTWAKGKMVEMMIRMLPNPSDAASGILLIANVAYVVLL